MSRFRRLVAELHRRSLWQVAAIYLAAGWGALEVAGSLTESAGLPDWFPSFALGLLVVGFPIVVATAFVQEGPPATDGAGTQERAVEPTPPVEAAGKGTSGGTGWRSLLTWRNALGGGVAAFALWGVVAAAWLLTRAGGTALPGAATGTAVETGPRTLAVLPFSTGGGSPESRAFAVGVHDELLARLSRIGALRVTSRTSVLGYADKPKPIRQIGTELGVEAILEGRVQWAGDSVRVAVQLIDAAADHHIWAENYQRPFDLDGIFALQTELVEAIAGALHATLLPEELVRAQRRPTTSLAALQLVAQAKALNQLVRSENEAAIALLRRARELDPRYAEAHAELGYRYWHRRNHGFGPEWNDSARTSAARAVEIDPGSIMGARVLGLGAMEAWQLSRARTLLGPGAESDPMTALDFGLVELYSGRWDEAAYWMRRAALADPLSPWPWWGLGAVESSLERDSLALAYAERALAHDPDFTWTLYGIAFVYGPDDPRTLAGIARLEAIQGAAPMALAAQLIRHYLAEDWDAYLAVARRYHTAHPGASDAMFGPAPLLLGIGLAMTGDQQAARPHLESALAEVERIVIAGSEGSLPPYWVAQAAVLLGRHDEARSWLDEALDRGPVLGYVLRRDDPVLRRLGDDYERGRARREAMVERLRQQADARVASLPPLPPPPGG